MEENPDFGTPDELITTDVDCSAVAGRKYASLAAHASQSENIFFLQMGEELFGTVMGSESFVRVRTRPNAPDARGRPLRRPAVRTEPGRDLARSTWTGPREISGSPSPVQPDMGELSVIDSGSTDEALLAGMAVGDQAAAVVFVRRYQRRVFGLAYSMTNDASVAEEVAQEALIRVWRHAPVFDPRRGSVTSWVLTITRNLTIDALRMRRAVPTDPDDFAASAMMSLEHNPEDAVRRGDVGDVVRAALAELPAEQRRAVVLAAVYGRTALEISEEEGIPLGTAKTRIRTGLIRLRAAVEQSREVEEER